MPTPATLLIRFLRFSSCFLTCVLLLAVTCGPVFSASFDCEKASSTVEKMICGDATISELDSKLGKVYSDLRTNLNPDQQYYLRNAQSLWLKVRNGCRTNTCLSEQYQSRLEMLNRQLLKNQYADQSMEVTSVLEQTYDNAASIVVRFTVPVESNADFRRYLKISLNNVEQPNDNWLLTEDGILAVYPFVEPQKKYEVIVKPGLEAINGVTHAGNRSFTVNTRRSMPSASFASNGHVMSAQLKRALPVTTLNVDEVDLDFFRIAPDNIPLWSSFSHSQRRDYYSLGNFTKTNPLVYSGRFTIDHKRHQRTTTNIDLSGIEALDQKGAYLAVIRIPGQYSRRYDTNFFTVSDIGLQIRKNAKALHAISHSIVSGKPLENIEISLYKGKDLKAQQKTDQDGIATFGNWFSGVTTIIARNGDQSTVIRLDRPLDLSGIRNAVSRHHDTQVFAWGPRDLYRPGETLEAFAILRDFDGRSLKSIPIKAEIIDPTGSRAHATTLNQDSHGAYLLDFKLPESAKTGKWKLAYRLSGDNKILHEYFFSVEDFLPERMKLTLFDGDATKRRLLVDSGTLEIPVAGDYLYGAPASGNKVDGFVIAELDRHPFEKWSGYAFGIDGEKISTKRQRLQEINLSEEGKGKWQVNLSPWRDIRSPLALTTTASLYESGGRPVTRSISATRIKQDELVGIEPQFKERADNNSRPSFKLLLTDAKGDQLAGKGYQLSLVREDRNYYWTYDDNSGWTWHYDPMNYEVFSSRVEFDGTGSTSVSVPVKWGNYRLEVRNASNELVSSYKFRTRWYWWGNGNDRTSLKPDQVRMAFKDELYHQGDSARLLLTPPTDGLATITVENNDKVLWVTQQQVVSKGTEIEIPIADNWHRHDIYVTATVLTPGDMVHSVAPKRSFGFINLPLKRKDADLEVTIEAPERIQPKQKVTAKVTVSASQAIPANTFVTLAAVDVGVLNITRFATPDPADYLYGARRYDATYYDVYGRIIENAGFNYVQQRFGGGFRRSAAELSRGGDKPNSHVEIMAWQSKPVQVSADGTAEIVMDVPEFNGKMRWMAVVYSDQAYGNAEAETTVADKLVTQLSKPRFMAFGDSAQLSLDLSNQSGAPFTVNVDMAVSGAFPDERWQQDVTLADTQKTTLKFPVSTEQAGEGKIVLQVKSDPSAEEVISVQRDWSVGTRSAYPSITRKAQKVISTEEPWTPELAFDDLKKDSVQAQLILSSLPPIDVSSHFKHLLNYPYGCTEQSTSSGYPWVLVDNIAARSMGLTPFIEQKFKQSYTDEFRKTQIDKAVKRVLAHQTSNGGFGLWSNRSDEMNWLTVYVSDFLTDAKSAGAKVPTASLEQAIKRLQNYLMGRSNISNRWTQDHDYYSFATKAYTAYVLAKINRLNLSDLRRFYEGNKEIKSKSTLPWTHLGFAFDMLGDSNRAKIAYEKALQSDYTAGYYGTYGSQLRDLALSFAILAKRGQADGDMLLAIFELSKERRWLSTQERNALFKAALAAGTATGEKLAALITTTEFTQNIDQQEPFKSLLNYDQLASITDIKAQDHTVYASLELVGQYATTPPPHSNGLTIMRDYFDIDGQPIELNKLQSGALVIVRLAATADHFTPDGLVVDLLPAGLELENQNLSNASVNLSKIAIEGENLKDWRKNNQVQHVEYRDDRFVAALALERTHRNYYLYYLARAVTPGQYLVPPPYIEDMYRPYYQAIGATPTSLTVEP